MKSFFNLSVTSLVISATATTVLSVQNASANSAVVYLDTNLGRTKYLASGFINGIPGHVGQIPNYYFEDIKFQAGRSAGSYIVPDGWTAGIEGYEAHWDSIMVDYQVCKENNAYFLLPIHGLYGKSAGIFPGDNGNWTDFDIFFARMVSDIRTKGLSPSTGVLLEIWNEPDEPRYWNRTADQFWDYYGRVYYKLRNSLPEFEIIGPTMGDVPNIDNEWLQGWAAFVASNKSVPDRYTYHMSTGESDTISANETWTALLQEHGLPSRPFIINEYGPPVDRQFPSGDAFWISQVERVGALGLRSNFGNKEGGLHDFMDALLGKPGAAINTSADYNPDGEGYWTTGSFHVYKYYAQEMKGTRLVTQGTADGLFDVYATVGASKARVLTGARNQTGSWEIVLEGMEILGYPKDGEVEVRRVIFPSAGQHYEHIAGCVDGGTQRHTYTGGSLILSVENLDLFSTQAYEIELPDKENL